VDSQFVGLDSDFSTTIYQDLPTEPGKTYLLKFAFSARPFTPLEDNRLLVYWGGQLVADLSADGTNLTDTDWHIFTYTVQATSNITRLQFADGGVPNTVGTYLDAVEVYKFTYSWSGFFPPVDNPPTVNVARAGAAIPVKFSLGGDQGLGIFAAGYPASQPITCDFSPLLSDVEETATAGGSSLTYDPTTDQYTYIWKTDSAWKGTCRKLTVKLNDGSTHIANFQFK
jgi:hypothetical protein